MDCEECDMYIDDNDKGRNCSNKIKNIFKRVIIIVGIFSLIVILINVFTLGFSLFYIKNKYKDNLENSLTSIPYANQDIEAGTMVTASMISYNNYKRSELPDRHYYISFEDIVGKCVNFDVVIEENSLFYEKMLVACDEKLEDFYEIDE